MFTIILLVALIGVSETAYLISERRGQKQFVCPIGKNCALVLTSAYNRLWGTHVDVLGFLFYAGMSTLAALGVLYDGFGIFTVLMSISVVLGATFSTYFTYVQARILHAWCFWCLTSALNTFIMFTTVMIFLYIL